MPFAQIDIKSNTKKFDADSQPVDNPDFSTLINSRYNAQKMYNHPQMNEEKTKN